MWSGALGRGPSSLPAGVVQSYFPIPLVRNLPPTSFYPALSPLSKQPGQLESFLLKFTDYSLVIAVFIPMSCMAIVLGPLVKSKVLLSRLFPGLPFMKPLPGVLSYSPCFIYTAQSHSLQESSDPRHFAIKWREVFLLCMFGSRSCSFLVLLILTAA